MKKLIGWGLFCFLVSANCWGDELHLTREMTGPSGGAHFGSEVSGIGDFNQDGYPDIAVAAPRVPFAGSTEPESLGVVYVFFGGPDMDTLPDLFLHFAEFNPWYTDEPVSFGRCVCGGNLNGDGMPDIAVGAPMNVGTGLYEGATHVYFGDTASGDTLYPDVTFWGPVYGFLGSSLAMGDLNGDGCDDLCMGSDAFGYAEGSVYIAFGKSNMNDVIDHEIRGQVMYEEFGHSLSIGDLDKDNYEDIIVGTYGLHGSTPGRAYICFGSDSIDTLPDMRLWGDVPGDYFGEQVSYVDDMNLDGFGDMLVGKTAWWQDTSYVFFGGNPMDTIPDLSFCGEGVGIGDVNGDGKADMAIRTTLPDTTSVVGICFGGSGFDAIPDISVSFEGWVRGVEGAGDLNGDGYGEVAVSDSYDDEAGEDAGKIWIYTLRQWSVEEQGQSPQDVSHMLRVWPNPFLRTTTIRYSVPRKARVSLKVFDVTGRCVKTLVSGEKNPGYHDAEFQSKDLGPGVYFARLQAGDYREVQKLIRMR